ncbi:MAG: hypothetical protein F4Y11_03335 [Chloroflexi bacterium]|nr:hypothetical protein [Chloroflexota bacterium]
MIQSLARKRTHLAALAALAGLVFALFAAMQSASAAPSGAITFSDSDATVPVGSEVTVHVEVTDPDADPGATVAWVRVSGTLKFLEDTESGAADLTANSGLAVTFVADTTPGKQVWGPYTLVIPDGTPEGKYTVSARVDLNGATAGGVTTVKKTITVGGAGDGLGSASLVVTDMDGKANASLSTAPASAGTIYLAVQALNSLGNKSNNGDVDQVIVYARGGTIAVAEVAAADLEGDDARVAASNPNAITIADARAAEGFSITASGSVAVSIDVRATLIGSDGAVDSNTVTIGFTGPANAISVGDPSGPLGQSDSTITFEVKASDSAGTGVVLAPHSISAVVKDRSGTDPNVGDLYQKDDDDRDGCKDVGEDDTDTGDCNEEDDARTTEVEDDFVEKKYDAKTVVVPVTTSEDNADAGEYTLVVTFGTTETEVTFNVAGPAADIDATTDAEGPVGIGQVIEVTATVTDADGIPVKNSVSDNPATTDVDESTGERVTFTAVGALQMRTIQNEITTTVNTKDGVAKARFVVTQGSGTATIIVSAGDASTFVSLSDASADPVEEVEEISAANCLSSTNAGPASWTCEGGSDASAIFPDLQSRGATALWLWNGSSWLRYSLRDGAEIPGSTDFMIQNRDNLWISY